MGNFEKSQFDHHFEQNRQLWDAKTPVHLGSEFYDMAAFFNGKSSLKEIELSEVGEVRGKSLLHLQCHFGQDTLSWARLGAEVCGVDFSAEAIANARRLTLEMDLQAEFICCNVYDLPEHLKRGYEIVFSSYGVIGWLPDLNRWAEIIFQALKPGGFFYLAEFHPLIWIYDMDMQQISYSYFNEGVIEEESSGTYTDRSADLSGSESGWNHPLSDVINALLLAGLQLEFLHEFPYTPWPCFQHLERVGEDRYVFKHVQGKMPYVFSLKAHRPALS